jgi:hypothetical protein
MSKKVVCNDTDTGKQKWLEKSILHYHFVHHILPVDWPAQNWASMMKDWWLSMLANLVYLTQHCSKHLQHCTKTHNLQKSKKRKEHYWHHHQNYIYLLLVGITKHNLSIFLRVF